MVGEGKHNKILKYLRKTKTRRSSLRIRSKMNVSLPQIPAPAHISHPMGSFCVFSDEVLFHVFMCIPLRDLGTLALTSTKMRDKLVTFHYSTQALNCLKPIVTEQPEGIRDEKKEAEYFEHFLSLGLFLKKLTCLFATKERLRIVGMLLEKLKDTHAAFCENYDSSIAYRCYGNMFHAFIAGWELDEKNRAFVAIKGASSVDERLGQALKDGPGSRPWYEKYVRVFYREIFLDMSVDDVERGFWLCRMITPLPLFHQAQLLYILYGPEDEPEETIDWHRMATSPTFFGVDNKDIVGIASALVSLYRHNVRNKTHDNIISIIEELISDWCLENIAKLLKFCGDAICCEFLGSKAINGRTQDVAYISYYIAQTLIEDKMKGSDCNSNMKWFVSLVHSISKAMPCVKQRSLLVRSLFDIWEETILGVHDDVNASNDEDTELAAIFTASVHNLAKVSCMLLLDGVKDFGSR